MTDTKTRCAWAGTGSVYIDYHDNEWGKPVIDDRKLFEMLILEGAQAGLSWITILKRRQGYNSVFDNFDWKICANYTDDELTEKLKDARIVRNRLKVYAVRTNAIAFQNVFSEYGSFSSFVWGFVNYKPILNHFAAMSDVPSATPLSDKISAELKKRGFKFVGSTIIYAYMQAVGIVNDHVESCFARGAK